MRRRIILISLLMIFAMQGIVFAEGGGLPASASSSGKAMIVIGADPYNFDSTETIDGTIMIEVNDKGDMQSPLQNIDEVSVSAKFSAHNSDYEISIDEPMLSHGRLPTWFGVGYNQKMHGKTNIGTNRLPEVEADVIIWGWSKIFKDGQQIHTKVPANIKVMRKGPLSGITLMIGTEEKTLSDIPDGYLHIRWPNLDKLTLPKQQRKMWERLGWGALIFLNIWFGWLALREHTLDKTSN